MNSFCNPFIILDGGVGGGGNEIGTARVKCIDPGQTRTQTFRSRIKLVKS